MGKILKVKLGANPNSSSLGADLGILLLGAAGISLVSSFLSAAVRSWLGGKGAREVPGAEKK